jgi:hypothetical protein
VSHVRPRASRPAAPRVKAVAHIHSEWSDDASWPLSRIAQVFARRRYNVVLMCEHSRGFSAGKWDEYRYACAEASTPDVLLVPGIEYGDGEDVVHIPVWGCPEYLGDGLPTGHLLKRAAEAGATAVWAHPWRRDAWQRFDPSWLGHLAAVEVWNRKYDGIAPSRGALALTRREHLPAFAALDFHTRRQLFPLSVALQLDGSTSAAAVYTALAGGRFTPRAFGLPVDRLARGPGGIALQGLEVMRRAAARALR